MNNSTTPARHDKDGFGIYPQFTLKEAARRFPFLIDEDRNPVLDAVRKAGEVVSQIGTPRSGAFLLSSHVCFG